MPSVSSKIAKLSPAASRLCQVLEVLYSGNCSKMAEAVDCSPSLLSRIAKGEREPGRNLLEKIGGLPKVNPAWILSGTGEPFLESKVRDGIVGSVLPIARVLFDGEPLANEPCLSGEFAPVAATVCKPTRYWLRIEHAATSQLEELRLHSGDMLLMESAAACRRTIAHLQDRICIYRDVPSNTLQLGYVVFDRDTEDSSLPLYVIRLVVLSNSGGAQTKGAASGRRARQIGMPAPWTNISIKDVVAVAIQLVRGFDLGFEVNLKRLEGATSK